VDLGAHHGSWLEWLYTTGILPAWVPSIVPHSFVVILLLTILSILASRNIKKIPSGVQNFMEWAVEGLENFTVSAIGPEGRKYTPLIGTFFLYIAFQNLIGLVPGMLAPTSSLNTTIALGLCAIIAVHFYAIRDIGFKTWAMHFMGEPKWLAPLMIPLHIVGELARPLSLSLRLFGNIFGEETVLVILAGLSPVLLHLAGMPLVALPVQLPMMLFGVFTSLLQALVFSMLLCIYITVTVGEHHAHEHDGHDGHDEHERDVLANAVPA
jgi:F-type H+-transporting ATPase subunit a